MCASVEFFVCTNISDIYIVQIKNYEDMTS